MSALVWVMFSPKASGTSSPGASFSSAEGCMCQSTVSVSSHQGRGSLEKLLLLGKSRNPQIGRGPGERSSMPPKKARTNAKAPAEVSSPIEAAPTANRRGRKPTSAIASLLSSITKRRATKVTNAGDASSDANEQPLSATVPKRKPGRPRKGERTRAPVELEIPGRYRRSGNPRSRDLRRRMTPRRPAVRSHPQAPRRPPRPNPNAAAVPQRPQETRRPPRSESRAGPRAGPFPRPLPRRSRG